MIFLNDKEISAVEYNNKIINYIYRKGKLVWQAIRSCFGAGFWINDYPWSNDEIYKD